MKTKNIVLLAILLAINVVVSFIYIPVAPNLRIYFTFIITMMIASNFSLSECLIYSVLEDLISFFLYPTGPFFPGYTLTAFLSMLIYWLFLNKKVDLKNIMISKAIVNIFINVGLGSLWSSILYSKAFIVYASTSLVKNLILFPIEALVFFSFYKFVQPLFDKYNTKKGTEK